MTYAVTDIAELIRHHLVFAAENDEQADSNLASLVGLIASMRTTPLWREAEWHFCDHCGTSVDTDMVAHDHSNFTSSGDFLCSSCLCLDDQDSG